MKVVLFSQKGSPLNFVISFQDSSQRSYQKAQAAAELTRKLDGRFSSSAPMGTRDPSGRGISFGLTAKKPNVKAPSADEAKRIAKIFGSKYSVPS